jgi:hypothetical protein
VVSVIGRGRGGVQETVTFLHSFPVDRGNGILRRGADDRAQKEGDQCLSWIEAIASAGVSSGLAPSD